MRSTVWMLAALALAAACSSSGGKAHPSLAAVASGSPVTLVLDTSTSFQITLTPADGFSGTVALAIASNGAGIRVTPASVSVPGPAPVSTSITIDTGDLANAVPGKWTSLIVRASSGTVSADATLPAITILPQLTMVITSAGSGATGGVWGADATTGTIVHMGTDTAGNPNQSFKIAWRNADSVNHTIHANGYDAFGFFHGSTPTDPSGDSGNTQERTVTPQLTPAVPARTFFPNNFYCHTHGAIQPGKLTFKL